MKQADDIIALNGAVTLPYYGSPSSQVIYSRELRKTNTFEHEENINTAREMKQAWSSFLETLSGTTHYKTFPFLEDVECYLRQRGDPRDIIDYDPKDIIEREEKVQEFYKRMENIKRKTRRAPFNIKRRQTRFSKEGKVYLEKISTAIRSLPLDNSLWIDFAKYLQEDGELESIDRQALEEVVTRYTGLRNRMVQGNLRLVLNIAKFYRGKGLEYPELIQEGNIGLMKGVEKFDYTRGHHLSTYVTYWIRHEIQRALSNRGREIRTPAHTIEKISKVRKVEYLLEGQLERKPTLAEIAEKAEFSEQKVEELKDLASRHTYSLQAPRHISEDPNDSTLEDALENTHVPSPLDESMEKSRAEEVRYSLNTELSPREQKIIMSRFGLGDDQDQTLKSIGDEYGLTRERIRQIEAKALGKLNRSRRLRSLAR